MKKVIKSLINRAVRPWGMELTYSHLLSRHDTVLDWLRELDIRTVLDVGANDGQFARDIAGKLPDARVISFEPLRDVYEELRSKCPPPRFRTYNLALGDEDSRTAIRRSRFSPSSSLLPMLALHSDAFPYTAEARTEEIEVRRLDSLGLDIEPSLLVKLDVQGYEDRVVRGGRETISRAACVISEVSFEPLYEGQPLFDDINNLLKELGFTYHGNREQLLDPRDGRVLQADAIFMNTSSV